MLEMLLKIYIMFSGSEMRNAIKCLNSVFYIHYVSFSWAHCGSEHIHIHVGNSFLANWIMAE